jgi:hypothetical protein
VTAVDDVVAAFDAAGWTALVQQGVHGGRSVNPSRVDLARGKQYLQLLVYAWKITGEGKGRSGDNYRIQTTRSHGGDLMTESDRLTLGFGVDERRGVLAVFDGWTKRATGGSSSVHIRRDTLDRAAQVGYADQAPGWDSRAAVRVDAVDALLPWIAHQRDRRLTAVHPLAHVVDCATAAITCDLWDAAPAAWLRPKDRLVLADATDSGLLDGSLWEVSELAIDVTKPGRNQRRTVTFDCRRYGRVSATAGSPLLRDLTGRSDD